MAPPNPPPNLWKNQRIRGARVAWAPKKKEKRLTQLPQQPMFQLICLVMDSSDLHSCLFQPWPQLGQEKTLQKRWTSCDVQCTPVYCYFSIPSGSIHGNPVLKYENRSKYINWLSEKKKNIKNIHTLIHLISHENISNYLSYGPYREHILKH